MCYRNEAIETIEKGIFKLEIFQDINPESPMEWGWPVKLITPRRHLDRMTARDIIEEYGNIWYAQVHTYTNRIDLTYVIARKDDWLKAMSKGAEDAKYHGWDASKQGMQKMVEAMAETMQQYYDGDIYEYRVSCGDEIKDSCCGFYGIKDAIEEGKRILDFHVNQETEAEAFERSAMAI